MRSVRVLAVVVVIASLAVTAAVAQQRAAGRSSQGRPLALVGGTLIDGTGSAPLRDSVVLIRGERIEKIGTTDSLPVPNGYEAVSTEGLTVLPGLWDLHVHLMYAGHPDARYWFDTYTPQFERVIMPASAEQMLMAGVTTVRDLAAPPQPILAVREAHRERRNPRADGVRRRSGAHERREPERRSDVECLRRGRCEGEDQPTDRRRRRLDQGHQRRSVDAGGDEGDCRRGARPRPQGGGPRVQRSGDSAGVDRRRRRSSSTFEHRLRNTLPMSWR